MINPTVFWLGFSLSMIIIAIIGILSVRFYNTRLSRIDDELNAIKVMLSEIPKETSLQEYMFSHDQRLCSIGEKLDTHPDPDLLRWYIHEHTEQLGTIISMIEDGCKTGLTKADLDNSLRVINSDLGKVLWSLRFDEVKYAERTAESGSSVAESGKARDKHIDDNSSGKVSVFQDDAKSMKAILNDSGDGYDAMLKYMQRTGKSGINALNNLDMAVRGR
jgi:hypothetical protein